MRTQRCETCDEYRATPCGNPYCNSFVLVHKKAWEKVNRTGWRWEDTVIGLVNVSIIASLLPLFAEPVKPPLLTSIPTGMALLAMSGAVLSLGARWGASVGALTAGIWFALAILRAVGL
jgi:hypothetical protein